MMCKYNKNKFTFVYSFAIQMICFFINTTGTVRSLRLFHSHFFIIINSELNQFNFFAAYDNRVECKFKIHLFINT